MSSYDKIQADQYPKGGKSGIAQDHNALKKEGRDFQPSRGQYSSSTTGFSNTNATTKYSDAKRYCLDSASMWKNKPYP